MRRGTRFLALAAATALIAAGCGSSSSSGSSAAGVVNGGILQAGIPGNPDHLDPALSYTNEGWEILEATNNGLLTFKKAAGGAGATVVPDIASAMPTVTDGGKTYTFHLRSGVMFGNPINREVKPSDFKFSIERLFRVDSGGVGFFTGIAGANSYAKTRKGGISGIVADDKAMTITFHLTQPDGTFNDYIATPFAFVMPVGTPDKDVSTIPQWRVPTGPYAITGYVPHQSVTIRRNPHFHSWTPDTPDGHIDGIDVHIGVTPEESVNEIASGQLDWYFESVPPDRLTALKAQYPKQVYPFTRNNTTFFVMNERKYPFNKLAVRQAVNYAIDRNALVKIYGGQGTPTENIIPPGFGSAYKPIHLYPHDINKAKQLIQQAGVEGAAVTVWGHNTDPTPGPCSTWPACSTDRPQGHREDLRRVGLLAHDRHREGRPPDHVQRLERGLSGSTGLDRRDAERRAHRQRRQQRHLEHQHPRLQQADRPGQGDAAGRGPKRPVGEARLPVHEERCRLGAVHEP